jgi:hypothetical protein
MNESIRQYLILLVEDDIKNMHLNSSGFTAGDIDIWLKLVDGSSKVLNHDFSDHIKDTEESTGISLNNLIEIEN